MTVRELLKHINKNDYDKEIMICDGENWTNVEKNISIGTKSITLSCEKLKL